MRREVCESQLSRELNEGGRWASAAAFRLKQRQRVHSRGLLGAAGSGDLLSRMTRASVIETSARWSRPSRQHCNCTCSQIATSERRHFLLAEPPPVKPFWRGNSGKGHASPRSRTTSSRSLRAVLRTAPRSRPRSPARLRSLASSRRLRKNALPSGQGVLN
jgi:hypothetical protein